ncbi:MAG TPA: M20/M25/M40 family metallo-hydrolase, partial [Longimicrobiaceae bacterium]|nr:M20/M25/M40 family metallo-hydrolase [Longimicrobiaceae bacterium]
GQAAAAEGAGTSPERVRGLLSTLAADSMEGRRAASPGSARAARWIAERLAEAGARPAGDSGFFQRVPMARVQRPNGTTGYRLLDAVSDLDTVPAERRAPDVNVVGVLPGSDPALRDEYVVVGAHFDHIGIGRPVDGDSINNGADDDASGVVAVLEIARALAQDPPRRSVVFLLTTGEEVGFTGIRWYVRNPTFPLERTVADVQIEMIGRPDSLAGGPGRAWLTGYDRSTVGEMLRAAGNPIVPDPRPAQNFFERSDNVVFAWKGVPAHTLSSFGLHEDYHGVNDEVERIDFGHMARVIDAAARAVRMVADGPAPEWKPGGRPTPPPNFQ